MKKIFFSFLLFSFFTCFCDEFPYTVFTFVGEVNQETFRRIDLRPDQTYQITYSIVHNDGGDIPEIYLFQTDDPNMPYGDLADAYLVYQVQGREFDVVSGVHTFSIPSSRFLPYSYFSFISTGNISVVVKTNVDPNSGGDDSGGDDGGDDSGGGSGGDDSGGGSGGDDSGGGSGDDESGQEIVVPSAPDVSNPELPLGDFRGIIRSGSEITVEIPGQTEYPEIKFPVPIPGHSNFKVNFFGAMDNPIVFQAYETFRMGFKAFCIVAISFVFFRNTFKLFRKNS